ncbi:hypothetical protein HQ487_02295 [Candidatus Uhrbacteria bacterium]|nr:hypothetical protein [Candidatus Uhrbacteria bacterium]
MLLHPENISGHGEEMPFPPLHPSIAPIADTTEQMLHPGYYFTGFGWEAVPPLILLCIVSFLIGIHKPESKRQSSALLGSMLMICIPTGIWVGEFGSLWGVCALIITCITLMIGIKMSESEPVSPQTNLDDEQIKRVMDLAKSTPVDDPLRQQLLDLATGALPRLVAKIALHTKGLEQLRPLIEKLPENMSNWSMAQKIVRERFDALVSRHARLQSLESNCREQLDALEAVMLDRSLTGMTNTDLDDQYTALMRAVTNTLQDAQSEDHAHAEVNKSLEDPIDLTRRRNASARSKQEQ